MSVLDSGTAERVKEQLEGLAGPVRLVMVTQGSVKKSRHPRGRLTSESTS